MLLFFPAKTLWPQVEITQYQNPIPLDHGLQALSRFGSVDVSLGLVNIAYGAGGFYLSSGIPVLFQLEVDLHIRGEGSGLHLALTTLPAALYVDFDKYGLGVQLDTVLATGFHVRTGIPGLSHAGLDLWVFGNGLHLGTDSLYGWHYWGGRGYDFINRRKFALSQSPIHKARFFGAYGGPGYQGFGMIGAPVSLVALAGSHNASWLEIGAPGFTERPRDAVDGAYRLHDIQFIGAGGPYSWAWGGENDKALIAEIRRTDILWWHNPFALTKALLTMLVWD